MMVYVDDFKMAGPAKWVKKCWDEMRPLIEMDDPAPVDRGAKPTSHRTTDAEAALALPEPGAHPAAE